MKKSWNRSNSVHAAMAQRKGGSEHPGPAVAPAPSHDEIARRAYELFVTRGCTQGQDQQDWLQAERELKELPATAAGPAPGEESAIVCTEFEASTKEYSSAGTSLVCVGSPVRRNAPPGRQDGREA